MSAMLAPLTPMPPPPARKLLWPLPPLMARLASVTVPLPPIVNTGLAPSPPIVTCCGTLPPPQPRSGSQITGGVLQAPVLPEIVSDLSWMVRCWPLFRDGLRHGAAARRRQPPHPRPQESCRRCQRGLQLAASASDHTCTGNGLRRVRESFVFFHHSAVVGSITVFTSATRFAGNPPWRACSRTMLSFGAMYTQ